ncbi:MAG: hypothetical protein MN733_44245 [Nitrososphaera sp.]|nr:hypothetical protein [Nitrososphaera sp.]
MISRKIAAAAVSSTFISACIGPLAEKPYGTTVHQAYECGQFYCNSAAMVETVKEVREGSFIRGGRFLTSVAYHGWRISRIGNDGVEIKPSVTSPERIFIPYNEQVTSEYRSPARYNFESSLLFERGDNPGTAVMTILERAR